MLKKLHVNIPFIDALPQIPIYAKFLKEIISKNRKIDEAKTLNKLPTKFKDPDSFFIPCLRGNVSIDRAFCDIGSSVGLISYSILRNLT